MDSLRITWRASWMTIPWASLTVQHPKRGRLLHIGDREANWLCMLNANAPKERPNVECVELEAPPKQGKLGVG
eukprot:COSAG05_NODE_24304_length_253_cov_0.725490_1_plen_72_part_01